MDEIDLFRMQENEAFGAWLIEAIGRPLGIGGANAAKRIDKAIYKGTECGAWVQFDEHGIIVGSIVEGSDAEFSKRVNLEGIDFDTEGAEEELNRRFYEAIDEINDLAVDHWNEINGDENE